MMTDATHHDGTGGGLPAHLHAPLLEIARTSIRHGLEHRKPLHIDPLGQPAEFLEKRATFVTLQIHGHLRGCIGMLEAVRSLVVDVADNAFAAAFEDPRFPALEPWEFDRLHIHISILSPPVPLPCVDEADLLRQLRPGMDGLIIHDGRRRATFLPSVWEELRDPREFLLHLKMKAGMQPDHWSPTFRAERYTAESVS